jgi:hypothetical protein
MPWCIPFEDPVPLPNGRKLLTLKDAADYITKLPKAEQKLPEWQTAIACLIGGRRRSGLSDARAYWHAPRIEPKRRADV